MNYIAFERPLQQVMLNMSSQTAREESVTHSACQWNTDITLCCVIINCALSCGKVKHSFSGAVSSVYISMSISIQLAFEHEVLLREAEFLNVISQIKLWQSIRKHMTCQYFQFWSISSFASFQLLAISPLSHSYQQGRMRDSMFFPWDMNSLLLALLLVLLVLNHNTAEHNQRNTY